VDCQKVHADKETWWWNEEVAEAVREKKIKCGNWIRENSTDSWKEYKKSRQNAKRVISSAEEKKQKECASDDGRLYSRCVISSMLHGSVTWSVRKENEVALQQALR